MNTSRAFRILLTLCLSVLLSQNLVAAQDVAMTDVSVGASVVSTPVTDDPWDTTPWIGARIVATDADGTVLAECVTAGTLSSHVGGCVLTLPTGAEVTISVDTTTAPAGSTVDSSTAVQTITVPVPGYSEQVLQPFVANMPKGDTDESGFGYVDVNAYVLHRQVLTEYQEGWVGANVQMHDQTGALISECTTEATDDPMYASCRLTGPANTQVTITVDGSDDSHTLTLQSGENLGANGYRLSFGYTVDELPADQARVSITTIQCPAADSSGDQCTTWEGMNVNATYTDGTTETICIATGQNQFEAWCGGAVSTTQGVTIGVASADIPAGYKVVGENNVFGPGELAADNTDGGALIVLRLVPDSAAANVTPTAASTQTPASTSGTAVKTTPTPARVTTLPSTGVEGGSSLHITTTMVVGAMALAMISVSGVAYAIRKHA